MKPQIAVYSGSFNPPGAHHQNIVRELSRHFDEVLVVPSGIRPDKPATDNVPRVYRATMADLAFSGLEKTRVELFDLERDVFTRTHELQRRFEHLGELWHIVGTNLVVGGQRGESVVHRLWAEADNVWRGLNFAVVTRRGVDFASEDLPPHHRLFPFDEQGSSADIRGRLFRGEPIRDLVAPEVVEYIDRHQLYRGSTPRRTIHTQIDAARLLIVADPRNAQAQAWREHFRPYSNPENPNLILAIGGDGTMLHAIQDHWRKRVPFFGINAGHLGFLMNDASEVLSGSFPHSSIVLRQMPMIHAEFQSADGQWKSAFSFNDIWVERASGQTAWLRVAINGSERFAKMVSDGLLLSTAAGSTAYALSMGATPLLADTPAWLVVGNNVMTPRGWKSAMLSCEDRVEVEVLNPEKRPVRGFVYGSPVGEVRGLRARISRIAAAEVAFLPHHDMAHKITELQFPAEP
jgi:NAD+ kinase